MTISHDSPNWKPYSISFYSDGVRYTTTIHALSDEHAEYVLDDLKDTAIVAGKIVEEIKWQQKN